MDHELKRQRMQTADTLDTLSCTNVNYNESLSNGVPGTVASSDNQKFEPMMNCLKGSQLRSGCSFSDALDKDLVFIDKTLFVEALLTCGSRGSLITAPRRMGKSFNLTILQEFFSPCDAFGYTRDPQERLKGLKIMEKEKLERFEKYMGKRPVVYLNLDRKSNIENLDDVQSRFRDAVYESHLDHLYLLQKDDPELFQLVKDGRKKWMLDPELNTSLKTLTRRLREHHENPCVFIADGYDTMLTQIAKYIFRSVKANDANFDIGQKSILLEQASDFILGTLNTVIKGNNQNVEFAVLTGISDIASAESSGPLNDVDRYRFLRNSEFNECFGLLENEFNEVMIKFKNNDSKLEAAKKLYNGYRFIDNGEKFSIYNPWATFKFAKTRKSTSPPQAWCETGTIGGTTNVCKIVPVRDSILNLIRGGSLRFKPVEKITYQDLITLANMCESPVFDGTAQIDLYYTHLLNQGYLAIIEIEEDYIVSEIPNEEIKKEFVNFLSKHAEHAYGIRLTLLPDCSKIIFKLLKLLQEDQDITEFEPNLKELYDKLKLMYTVDESKTNLNEFVINCISFLIGNQMTKYQNCCVASQLYCNDGINKGYLDVAYSYEKCVIIFENKLNDTVRTAIDQILQRNYLSPFKDHKFVLIGTTLDYSNSKIYKLGYLMNSLNVDDLTIFE